MVYMKALNLLFIHHEALTAGHYNWTIANTQVSMFLSLFSPFPHPHIRFGILSSVVTDWVYFHWPLFLICFFIYHI